MTANPKEKPLFRIDYDGCWYHDGGVIKRKALAKLFADRGLKIDAAGTYWLSSPESKYEVDVEDVPFVVVDYDIQNPGPDQQIDMKTNMDDVVPLGPDHGLELRPEPRGGIPVPYIEIRKGLYARLSRPVYYRLIDLGTRDRDRIILHSRNMDHLLGRIEQDNAV
jgi:hypothetical protein